MKSKRINFYSIFTSHNIQQISIYNIIAVVKELYNYTHLLVWLQIVVTIATGTVVLLYPFVILLQLL
jgi:hypothetical protein